MIIIKQPGLLKEFIARQKAAKLVTGFVPTMGALHAGHLDLVNTSGSRCDVTVVSIFVNPAQFNDPNDFIKYPITLEKDIRLLERSTADVLFVPQVADLYPDGLTNLETYDLGYLETLLEGSFRPGHFQGVCQVMDRLIKLVQPEKLFMGRKDYQQCMVVARLLEQLEPGVELIKCPTVREPDGLAMSSRNLRLAPAQRAVAPELFSTLKRAKEKIGSGDLAAIRERAIATLQKYGFKTDYFEIADASTLMPVKSFNANQQLVILCAAFLGEVRLIDNLLTDPIFL